MKQDFLYHGSPLELELLEPRQAICSSGLEENNLFGVYASENRGLAIASGIVNCKGIIEVRHNQSKHPPYAIILEGQPNQNHIYLYTLPIETFENANRTQWLSQVPVKPILIEILAMKKLIPKIVRYATDSELEFWHVRSRNNSNVD